jgi:FixJ family two-component response regulator
MAQESTVFIVDDDEAVRRAVTRSLTLRGYRVEAFSSAESFLSQYSNDDTGCLVLDVRMPGMSGVQLQQELARRHSKLPVVFVTGHGEGALSGVVKENGALDILEKPYTVEALIARLKRALVPPPEH